MASKNKTVPTDVSPIDFLDSIENARRRADGHAVLQLMQELTGEEPVMWGPSIIGFGRTTYETDAGRKGEIMRAGFSPRKANLVFYLGAVRDQEKIMQRLGKHKRGKGCLYINKLDDVDLAVLEELVCRSVAEISERYEVR